MSDRTKPKQRTSAPAAYYQSAQQPAAGAAGAAGAADTAGVAAASPAAALDLASLEQRLRDTRAIGIFTKLTLKNQVDDLLSRFRLYHSGRGGANLGQLRQSYNLLLLKVLSLLQGKDAGLASAISASREALWNILADPKKFAAIQ